MPSATLDARTQGWKGSRRYGGEIIDILDDRKLSIRDAEKLTGVSHSEFSRIRNTQLRRFTLDRMIAILGKLDEDAEATITFRPRRLARS